LYWRPVVAAEYIAPAVAPAPLFRYEWSALRSISTDGRLRLDVAALRRPIEEDLERGLAALMVVATAGTTSAGTFGPVAEISGRCRDHGLWLQVDAAEAGPAAPSARLSDSLGPIWRADSITCDPQTWFNVSMAAGIILCSHVPGTSSVHWFRSLTNRADIAGSAGLEPIYSARGSTHTKLDAWFGSPTLSCRATLG
jgi:glutamate/tyrosine decarboxylase-like PLP-dependent enzyme